MEENNYTIVSNLRTLYSMLDDMRQEDENSVEKAVDISQKALRLLEKLELNLENSDSKLIYCKKFATPLLLLALEESKKYHYGDIQPSVDWMNIIRPAHGALQIFFDSYPRNLS